MCHKIGLLLETSINHSVLPKGRYFTANAAFSTLPSSQSFLYLYTIHLSWCCLSSDIFFCYESSSRLPFILEHPSAGSSFLASDPANFFSSSLSVPALFFLLALFEAELHFLFYQSILHAPFLSIFRSQMQIQLFLLIPSMSKSLHHITLHSTQSTSLASSLVLFPRVCRKNASLPVKSFFWHCYPLHYFLTVVQVATDIVPQVFEAVHSLVRWIHL